MNNVAAGTPELSGDAGWKISAKKGSTVSLKLEADTKFQVTEVTDGDQTAVTPVAGVYNAGKSALTLNDKIVVSFAAKEGYELGDVKVGGEKVEPTTVADSQNGTPAKYEAVLL